MAKRPTRSLLLVVLLAGCGGANSSSSSTTGTLSGTLAYVVSECRDVRGSGYFFRQTLRIQQGDGEPITVVEVPQIGPLNLGGFCKYLSSFRFGQNSTLVGAVQRLAVSRDGATVAFELTDEFSGLGHDFFPAEQEGIFVVRADGSGLRRLGPASRQASWLASPGFYFNDLGFSPDGRTLTFPDLGPGPDGTETSQVFLQDAQTGARGQITHFAPATPAPYIPPGVPSVWSPRFLDDDTVGFFTYSNVNGENPQGDEVGATVLRDGENLKMVPTIALPGGLFTPTFIITGDRPVAAVLPVPGEPVNGFPPGSGLTGIREMFQIDGDNVLQLTNFHRSDTGGGIVGVDRRTVFFEASADPFGENPSEECQVFAIDRTGTNLRQITRFSETGHSLHGCTFDLPVGSGCATFALEQDARTQALLLYSSCDPLGTHPLSGQLFTVQPDGSELQQVTDTRGLVTEADGTVVGEFPGPLVYRSRSR